MTIFNKFQSIETVRQRLVDNGCNPLGTVVEKVFSATEGMVNGRRVVLAGTNNYLGITFDPECIQAAVDAVVKHGTGTTGSRMANGTYAEHLALEQELTQFFNAHSVVVFTTGYQATMGMVSTLMGQGEVILLDADSHASIYDGSRLGGAEVIRFRHNDVNDLEKCLRRLGDRVANTLIVVEGIYSMLGDAAPLRDIVALKQRFGCYLLVDEAHSLGVLGRNGQGLAEEVGVSQDVDFIVGTFSKSLASVGGFCVSRRAELELIRYAARPYIFTASSTPAVIAATRSALRIMKDKPELRKRLWINAYRVYEAFSSMGFSVGPQPSPIVAVMMKNQEQAIAAWNQLLNQGVYVNLVLPPAAPKGGCLLRCSVSAAHTPQQIDKIVQAYATVAVSVVPNTEHCVTDQSCGYVGQVSI